MNPLDLLPNPGLLLVLLLIGGPTIALLSLFVSATLSLGALTYATRTKRR